MNGLDTNVLVRYVTQDDAAQAKKAGKCITSACTANDPCQIERAVLCDLVWVLESGYGYARSQIGEFMDSLLHTRQFEFESRDAALAALRHYRQGKADFADALIGAVNRNSGCKTTFTFDRKAAGLETFTLL